MTNNPRKSMPRLWLAVLLLVGVSTTLSTVAVAGGERLLPVQYGSKQVVCDEIRQRYAINQRQLNAPILNLLFLDAAERGCKQLVLEFLEKGAAVGTRDRFGNTALLKAARLGENDVVDLLLSVDADIHHQNLAGSTALLQAATMSRRRTLAMLLEHGAAVNIANRRGVTPLLAAAYNGNERILELLLAAGADPKPLDATGKSALVYAAARGFPRVVLRLLRAGVDANTRHDHSLTALMWAAGHTNDVPVTEGLATVRLLLEHDAGVNLVDDRGRTALMIAAERGHAEVVAALLAAGADATVRDAEGKTALDLASDDTISRMLLR